MPYNTEEIIHRYNSKYNLNHENQVILLMITDRKKWHYLAVKIACIIQYNKIKA